MGRTGDTLAVNNWSGRPTAPIVDAPAEWSSKHGLPRRILMATGSNDIYTPHVFAEQIDRTMKRRRPAPGSISSSQTPRRSAIGRSEQLRRELVATASTVKLQKEVSQTLAVLCTLASVAVRLDQW
jgi:hypothetical protein